MRFNDALIGVVLVIFAMAVIAYSTTFPSLHGQAYGPSLFPTLIGCCLLACGLVLIIRGVHMHRRQIKSTVRTHPDAANQSDPAGWVMWGDWVTDRTRLINMLLVPGLLITYILLSDLVGFISLSIVMLSVLLYRLGTKMLPSILIAAATTVLLQLLFANVLLVPLPPGLLLHLTG